jgi:hypothetical protein
MDPRYSAEGKITVATKPEATVVKCAYAGRSLDPVET